jgi:replication protein CRI
MKTIDPEKPRDNQFLARAARDIGPVNVRASIDTIELIFQKPPIGLRTRIEAALGRRIEIKPCLDATGYQHGVRAIINRPNLRVSTVASEILRTSESARVFRVDVAFDFETATERSADALESFLDRHIVLKWRPAISAKQRVERTVYWAMNCRTRNLALYPKRARTIRLELRFLCSRSVRRADLAELAHLVRLPPSKLLAHNVKLVFLTERHIREAVRRTVRAERKRHMKRQPRSSRSEIFLDMYRSRIPRQTESILRRFDMQEAKSLFRATDLESVAIGEVLNIPTFLSWPDEPQRPSAGNATAVTRSKPYVVSRYTKLLSRNSRSKSTPA